MEFKKGIYKHYKGKLYEVIDIATHSETLEKVVVYKQFYGKYTTWVRPYEMFMEELDVNGVKVKRFEFISNMAER